MNESRLDPFSRGFAEILFGAHPGYRSHARLEDVDGEGESYLVVEVPCPNRHVLDGVMRIDTECEEITIAVDAYHTHFAVFASTDATEDYEAALAFIDDLLAERLKFVSWWSGETWRGSTALPATEPATTPHWITEAERLRVRSWLGNYDEDRRIE